MTKYLIAYGATMLVFFAIDFVWLGVVAKDFYRERLGALMLEQVNLPVAAVFYLIYIVGIVVFAISPALQGGSWKTALMLGGLFGFIAYGTYDVTNLATLRGWPVSVVIVDMAWGTVLTGVSATLGYAITRYFA